MYFILTSQSQHTRDSLALEYLPPHSFPIISYYPNSEFLTNLISRHPLILFTDQSLPTSGLRDSDIALAEKKPLG